MTKIAIIGDPVLDQIYETSDQFVPGGKMLGRFVGAVAGGTTSNFACAASNFGLNASMFGQITDGWEGDLHRRAFQASGVDAGRLKAHAVERGTHTVIAVGPDGEKSLIYVPFPETGDEEVTAHDLVGFDMVYVMAADFGRIATRVKDLSSQVCVDVDAAAGLVRTDYDQVARNADVVFINDVGFSKLFGKAPDRVGVDALLTGDLKCVVCSGGAGTSFAAHRGENAKIVSVQMQALRADVVDTTGAGDCFNAAFIAQLTEQAELEECLRFAMTAGAMATETLGARASIPERSAVIKRMKQ